MKISVVIPAYNRAWFTRQCLLSLNEAGVDCEVIVVDDGSTDETETVVRQTDPAAKFIKQANSGPAAARNNGFAHATGKYVCFLDCDDEWLPGQPAQAVDFLERHPDVDVLFADAQMGNYKTGFSSFIEMAGQKAFLELPHKEVEPGFRVLEGGPLFRRLAVRNAVFLGSTILRREAVEPFDTELCGAADWNLWMRLARKRTFAFWSEPLAVYTQHEGGMSRDGDGMNREFCEALRKLRDEPLDADERKLVDERLKHHLFGHAYRAYNRGDWREARRRFGEVIRTSGSDAKTLSYWALTALPFGKLLRKAKQAVAGTKDGVAMENNASSATRPGGGK